MQIYTGSYIFLSLYVYKVYTLYTFKMAKKTKLVNDIDNDVWNDFTAYCRKKGFKVGERINYLISKDLEKQERK